MFIQKRRIVADDEIDDVMEPAAEGGEGEVSVEPEATDLLFEAEDVAELVAEITGDTVDVTVDDEGDGSVEFAVGEDVYTVTPEEDTEVLESVQTKRSAKRRSVAASTNRRSTAKKQPTQASSKVYRKVPKRR